MKKMRMVLIAIMMGVVMGNNVGTAMACYAPKDFKTSVFKFNYQYSATDRPEDELDTDITALNMGTIFAIENGLFVTAAHNLNKIPGGTYSDELYYTKFEFESKDLSGEKTVTSLYGYYELVYIDKDRDIAIFKGDDFMNEYSKPLKLADKIDSYENIFSVGYRASGVTPKIIYANKEVGGIVSFNKQLDSRQSGSPLLNADGDVIGVIGSKEFAFDKDVYFVNLIVLQDIIDELLLK